MVKQFALKVTQSHTRSRLARYLFPLLLLAIVLVIKFFIQEYIHKSISEHLLTMVVILSAWYGGLGPGIFSSVITIAVNDLLFPVAHLPFLSFDTLLTACIFLLVGVLLSILSEAKHQVELQKEAYIGVLSHELKNPLTTIKTYTELLLRSNTKCNAGVNKTYISRISSQTTRMIDMINDLLDNSRMESGNFSYNDELFEIYQLLKQTIIEQQLLTKTHKIQLIGMTTKKMYGDKRRIKQVLINLLTNAIKYSPRSKEVVVRIKDYPGGVIISVKDFGIGIAKTDAQHIFDQFFRVEGVEKGPIQGAGLGLHITQQIVKRHNGKIWVTSTLQKGSTFYIYLPQDKLLNA